MSTALFVSILFFAWSYCAAAMIAAWRFADRPIRPPGAPPDAPPPVSVLKPLHGAEPGLYENLCSFVDQDYPEFQLVLGVRDHTDSALPVARALLRDRPDRDIELVIDSRVRGTNLKIANLENMLPAARHGLIVLADSDVRVTPEYLSVVTGPLAVPAPGRDGDPATGIVTCLYRAVPTAGFWSQLNALYINYGFLPSALVGEAIAVGGGCFGATIALRRDALERIGGFSRIRNELADDHRIGAEIRALGLKTVLSPYLVELRVTEPSLASLWRHELRWARTARTVAPAGYAGSAITHTVAMTALAAAAFGSAGSVWLLVLLAMLLRWLSGLAVARWLGLPRAGLWLLPLRDALSFAVFLSSFCGRRVRWRDRQYRVHPSGHMSLEGDKPL
jgi:ceramide glucosyltransferase